MLETCGSAGERRTFPAISNEAASAARRLRRCAAQQTAGRQPTHRTSLGLRLQGLANTRAPGPVCLLTRGRYDTKLWMRDLMEGATYLWGAKSLLCL